MAIPDGFAQVLISIDNDDAPGRASAITFGVDWPSNTNTVEDFLLGVEAFCTDVLQDMTTNMSSEGGLITLSEGGETGSFPFAFAGGKITGANSGSPMSPNVSYLLQKRASGLGRRYQGRMFLPGVSESDVDGAGVVDSALVTDMNNHLISGLLALSTAAPEPQEMVLFHSTGDQTPSIVTVVGVDDVVATQRRRLVRR